jgi:uncharacterized protein (UPF0332 family)
MPHSGALIRYRIELANEALEDARIALEHSRLRNALNRIYYAGFYITGALALKHNFATAKHYTLIGWFNRTFIKTKILDVEIGKTLLRAFEVRQESDYDDFIDCSTEQVQRLYLEMIQFVQVV